VVGCDVEEMRIERRHVGSEADAQLAGECGKRAGQRQGRANQAGSEKSCPLSKHVLNPLGIADRRRFSARAAESISSIAEGAGQVVAGSLRVAESSLAQAASAVAVCPRRRWVSQWS